ncbi:MAG: diiron oxygenase [Acinetobacter venetianus]|uniref:diiron oxygenase n=1 Tax=Acinetobacter venetianus TaxID=52133 RepID=UPI003C717C43
MLYQTHIDSWEQKATIRTRPRRIIEDDELSYYPKERQPLCFDPIIEKLGQSIQDEILLQSLYKYIKDIIIFETEIVNKTASKIAKGHFPYDFPFEVKHDAMSVVIDEDYHAFVAMDFQNQLELQTGIKPFKEFNEIELSRAIPRAIDLLDNTFHKAGMELIAVAISENTVTNDVAAFSRDPNIKRSVKGIMSDHLTDEGRHAKFWSEICKIYWANISEDSRQAIGSVIPTFLEEYLTNDIQKEFDTALINQLALPSIVKKKLIENTVDGYPITSQHPMMVNIRRFLVSSGISEHAPTRNLLEQYF